MQSLKNALSIITFLTGILLSILNIKDGNIFPLISTILATLALIFCIQGWKILIGIIFAISITLSLSYNIYVYTNSTIDENLGNTFKLAILSQDPCINSQRKAFDTVMLHCPYEAEKGRLDVIIEFLKSYYLPSPLAFMDHAYKQLGEKEKTQCEKSIDLIKEACPIEFN